MRKYHIFNGRGSVRNLDPVLIFWCFFFGLSLLFFSGSLHAGQVTITVIWDKVSEAEGYKLYYGLKSKEYSSVTDLGQETSCTFVGIPDGQTYYFAVTAYDSSGIESDYSAELIYKAPKCLFYVSPLTASFMASGGGGHTTLTTNWACTWTASSDAPWVTITSAPRSIGNGVIDYSVERNEGRESRKGGLLIGGTFFRVNQEGIGTFTIAASSGAHGSIIPSGSVKVEEGGTQSFIMRPDAGYRVGKTTVDGLSRGPIDTYTFTGITKNHTITASFAPISYSLTITKVGSGTGTVTKTPAGTTFLSGTMVAVRAMSAAKSAFKGWAGACSGVENTCQVKMTENLNVIASFVRAYTITASSGPGGSIYPSGSLKREEGGTQSFNITPSKGYRVNNVIIDGISVGSVDSYSFTNINANHSIKAHFIADRGSSQ